ncbi:hypothetical protein [Streptomyces sp. OR43]|uniref:hypothetical protein n=1 Tax=Streptomyces sp. or43 TaxID=2478957 RepID=UPI0011CEC69B|nr:hypothetical protein [Streptomyces sp. or43]TXS34507.1 hypothetical protein EAO72_41235 [Streptomyces sp. or43]
MTQQPEAAVQPFALHLDASDGSSISGVGVVWPDGAATLYRPSSPSVFPLTARSLDDLLTIFCGSHRHLYRIEHLATPAS